MLSSFIAIYTDGSAPADDFQPPAGAHVFLGEMGELIVPNPRQDELFGPHVTAFARFKPKRGFLLAVTQEGRGSDPVRFFAEARRVMLEATAGLKGMALDVLRLWPFPLELAAEALPEELLSEDLFALGITDQGEHGYRAETFGLAKLGQRELSFAFRGEALVEEAAQVVGHLADWLLEHRRIVEPGHALAFGFDRITFHAVDGGGPGPFRGWHPPLMQRLLPESLFPGVGVLDIHLAESPHDVHPDLTIAMQRALEQRLVLEENGLTGDAPHQTMTVDVHGRVHGLTSVTAVRDEPRSSRDSGWRLESAGVAPSLERGVMTVGDVARRMPNFVRYLALPPGVHLTWDAEGLLHLDASRAIILDDEAEPD